MSQAGLSAAPSPIRRPRTTRTYSGEANSGRSVTGCCARSASERRPRFQRIPRPRSKARRGLAGSRQVSLHSLGMPQNERIGRSAGGPAGRCSRSALMRPQDTRARQGLSEGRPAAASRQAADDRRERMMWIMGRAPGSFEPRGRGVGSDPGSLAALQGSLPSERIQSAMSAHSSSSEGGA